MVELLHRSATVVFMFLCSYVLFYILFINYSVHNVFCFGYLKGYSEIIISKKLSIVRYYLHFEFDFDKCFWAHILAIYLFQCKDNCVNSISFAFWYIAEVLVDLLSSSQYFDSILLESNSSFSNFFHDIWGYNIDGIELRLTIYKTYVYLH